MKPIREIVSTLQSEARFRPTIWGDARPLLIEAAGAIVFLLQNSLTAARTALRTQLSEILLGLINERYHFRNE